MTSRVIPSFRNRNTGRPNDVTRCHLPPVFSSAFFSAGVVVGHVLPTLKHRWLPAGLSFIITNLCA